MGAYRELGQTAINIFPIGLGAMPLSLAPGVDESIGIGVIKTAIAGGVNFIDSANVYCPSGDQIGHNERLINKALMNRYGMADVIVATKGGVDRRKGIIDASPDFLRQSCIDSLKALNQESIALYQLHSPDDKVPLEESVGELSLLQKEGKIIHIGLCNVTLDEIVRAQSIVKVTSVQNCCNPYEAEDYYNGIIQHCEAHGITYFPHSVIGGKSMSGQIINNPVIVEIAQQNEISPFVVVIAWHLAKSPRVVPIPGASKIESICSSITAAAISLSSLHVRMIDKIFQN